MARWLAYGSTNVENSSSKPATGTCLCNVYNNSTISKIVSLSIVMLRNRTNIEFEFMGRYVDSDI